MKKHIIVNIALLLSLPTLLSAQFTYTSPRSLAMGAGGVAYLGDHHSLFLNPANLLLNDRNTTVTIGLPSLSAVAASPLISVSTYNDFFTLGRTFDEATTNSFLDDTFDGASDKRGGVAVGADVVPFGFAFRRSKWAIGAAFRVRGFGAFDFSRGLAELGLRGLNQQAFADPKRVDFEVEGATGAELSFGFARNVLNLDTPIPLLNGKLSVGIAPKLLFAGGYYRSELKSSFQLVEDPSLEGVVGELRHDFEWVIESVGASTDEINNYLSERALPNNDANLGDVFDFDDDDYTTFNLSGLGLDLGATYEIDLGLLNFLPGKGKRVLRIAASITDIGKLSFDNNARRFRSADEFIWRGLDTDLERVELEFNDNFDDYIEYVLEDSVSNQFYGNFTPEDTDHEFNLPTTIHFGGHLMLNKLSVSVDVAKGLNSSAASSGQTSLALGAEYRLFNFFPVRAGARFGGVVASAYSTGLGLSFRHFDFVVSGMYVNNDSASDGFASVSTGIMIRI